MPPPPRLLAGTGFAAQLALPKGTWRELSWWMYGSAFPSSVVCFGSWGETTKSCFSRPWEQPSWAPACLGQAWMRRWCSQAEHEVVLQAKPVTLFAIKTAQPFSLQGLTSCRWTSASFKGLGWSFLALGKFSPSSLRTSLERTWLLGRTAWSRGEEAGCTARNSGGEITPVTVICWEDLPRKHQTLYNPSQSIHAYIYIYIPVTPGGRCSLAPQHKSWDGHSWSAISTKAMTTTKNAGYNSSGEDLAMLISEMKTFYGHLRTEQGRRHQQTDPGWSKREQPETGGFSGGPKEITFI